MYSQCRAQPRHLQQVANLFEASSPVFCSRLMAAKVHGVLRSYSSLVKVTEPSFFGGKNIPCPAGLLAPFIQFGQDLRQVAFLALNQSIECPPQNSAQQLSAVQPVPAGMCTSMAQLQDKNYNSLRWIEHKPLQDPIHAYKQSRDSMECEFSLRGHREPGAGGK